MPKTFRIGIVIGLLGVIGLCVGLIFRSTLIVSAGMSGADMAIFSSLGVILTGMVIILIGGFLALRARVSRQSELKRAGALSKSTDFLALRRELGSQKMKHPHMGDRFDRALAQMDEMTCLQNRLKEILLLSGTQESWSDITGLLDNVELLVGENMKVIVLRSIASSEDSQSIAEVEGMIDRQLASTQKLLAESTEALTHVADLIGANASRGDSAELDAYLKVLRDLVARNLSDKGAGASEG